MSQLLLDAAGRRRPPALRLTPRPAREGGRRREVGMDEWAWEQLQPWLDARAELPVGPLFADFTAGLHLSSTIDHVEQSDDCAHG